MQSKVHYDPCTLEKTKVGEYSVTYYSACGCLISYHKLRKGTVDVLQSTRSKEEVTCENCKRTNVYKEEK